MRALATALRIADTQFGIVTRRQLLGHRISEHQIRYLLRAGALETMHAGVYAVPGSPKLVEHLALGACLACGDDAAASFRTAAAIMRVSPIPEAIDVTVPHGRRPRRTGFAIHRSTVLGPLDVVRRGPLTYTKAARTLVDLSSCTDRSELALVTDDVLRRRLVSAKGLLRYIERPSIKSFPGTGTLRSIVKDRLEFGLPDTNFEGRMIDLITEYDLPRPSRQYWALASGRRVRFDLAYPDRRFVIELEGWDPHSGYEQWESDHERDNALALAGWTKLAFTWRQVNHRRAYVAVTVGEALGLRPSRWVAMKQSRSALHGRSNA